MLEPDVLSPDDERWLEVAMAVADGTPIDWSAATPSVETPSSHSNSHPVLVRLQYLERLVRGHEAVRSGAAGRHAALAAETLLTEARRKTALPAPQPVRVRWGPLIVLEKLGRGSFGDVYCAWDPRLDREVALKLVPEDASEVASSPVIEEGRLLARVRHPNVLTVHGAERIDGRVGIWTEYVRGETLAEEVARRGPLTAEDAARIGVEVCRALGAVHTAGVLHRDVKAQNILRDATGRLVLGDFGTGVECDEHAPVGEPQIAGTPLYLAPEIFSHQPATVSSDLYSVGVLLYFLVTADYPVRGRTFAAIKRAHVTSERVPLQQARPNLPVPFIAIVEGLLAVGPDRRYSSADAVERALDGWLNQSGAPPQSRPLVVQRLRSRRGMVTLAIGALLVVAAVVGAVRLRPHPPIEVPTGLTDSRPASAEPGTSELAQVALAESMTNEVPPASALFKPGDWVVVANVDNQTGESLLDGVIEVAVRRELEYSDHARVAQRGRVEDALASLGRPLGAQLDRLLARQVALRDGGLRALITGTILRDADAYDIAFEVVNPANRTTIAKLTDRAPRQSAILEAVRRQTLRIREALGEPPESIGRSREVFEHAPLPKLKALKLYADSLRLSRRSWNAADSAGVERIMRDAIREDPTFAGLYLQLALSNIGRGRPRGEIVPYTKRALRLAATATPQERYRITAHLHHQKAGDKTPEDPEELRQAVSAYEALFALQPDDDDVVVLLRNCYMELGRERDAAWLNLRLADVRPLSVSLNFAVAKQLLREGNFDGARRYATRAEAALSPASGGDPPEPDEAVAVRMFGAYLAWLQDDPRETLRAANQLVATAARLPHAQRLQLYRRLWRLYTAIGRLKDAERVVDALGADDSTDVVNRLMVHWSKGGFFEASGQIDRLRNYFAVARWSLSDDAPPLQILQPMSGVINYLIEAGSLDEAAREFEWLKTRAALIPADVAVRIPPISKYVAAALELARGHSSSGISLLQESIPIFQQVDARQGEVNLWTQYASAKLAAAFVAKGQLSNAIDVLKTVGDDRTRMILGYAGPHGWLQDRAELARLYRKNGQVADARAIEAHLLKLLAVADADHPLLRELRARH